ncbi:3'(2'),5'-bisphosphate nucleotidase CysQ [Pontibacter harenae]|uniref:3'(2'),5'-bisphosphate nucleotidase CysQ n=1 Tax=Pontibacter harenae TaxID=2894083 RepID=UPI001E622D59|nr:3'(2'),5'-bisphosphate nucleotidase CysQ [Pontibacter harenae]MCC9169035.1 3'(2'),5'-bisphosphate nucleotidase CysQ [Pontibacter harenae]
MTDINIASLLDTARAAALEAGKAIMEVYRTKDFEVDYKADDSPLTKADQAAHTIIEKHLSATGIPVLSEEGAHTAYQERKKWPLYWLIDPLDGTKEFVKKNGEFTVNIAFMQQSAPVAGVIYAPDLDALYYGSEDTGVLKVEKEQEQQLMPLQASTSLEELLQKPQVRIISSRSHRSAETEKFISQFKNTEIISMGSSLKFMLLAENKAEIYPRFSPCMEWDTAAAHAILKALNRTIYQTDLQSELVYNKEDLLNPSFIAF